MFAANYRKAEKGDLIQIYSFEKEYIQEIEPDNLVEWINAESRIKSQLHDNIDKMFVAETNEQILGHCYWNLHAGAPHIFSIFVSKFCRRQGIAAKLLECAEADIRKRGYPTCRLSTHVNNPAHYLFAAHEYHFMRKESDWLTYEKYL